MRQRPQCDSTKPSSARFQRTSIYLVLWRFSELLARWYRSPTRLGAPIAAMSASKTVTKPASISGVPLMSRSCCLNDLDVIEVERKGGLQVGLSCPAALPADRPQPVDGVGSSVDVVDLDEADADADRHGAQPWFVLERTDEQDVRRRGLARRR